MTRVHSTDGREVWKSEGNINMDFEELGLEGMGWIPLKIAVF
jgi:hypothetical protein